MSSSVIQAKASHSGTILQVAGCKAASYVYRSNATILRPSAVCPLISQLRGCYFKAFKIHMVAALAQASKHISVRLTEQHWTLIQIGCALQQ